MNEAKNTLENKVYIYEDYKWGLYAEGGLL